ncbi:MAG: hypothetical protein LBH68_00390, partial [Bifidobacteriaceae bacterium]|nr:hypothetical protein [Bifidobacteriaceae bacterium]
MAFRRTKTTRGMRDVPSTAFDIGEVLLRLARGDVFDAVLKTGALVAGRPRANTWARFCADVTGLVKRAWESVEHRRQDGYFEDLELPSLENCQASALKVLKSGEEFTVSGLLAYADCDPAAAEKVCAAIQDACLQN